MILPVQVYRNLSAIAWKNFRVRLGTNVSLAWITLALVSAFGLVHTKTEEFQNGRGLTPKAHQMGFVRNAAKKFKNLTITGHFWICV